MRLADLASILAQGCTLWTDSFKLSGTPARSGGFRFYNNIPVRMQKAQEQVDSLHQQIEAAKLEITQPFPQELELTTKSARLAELDALLSMDKSAPMNNKSEKPSVLASLERSSSGMQKDAPQRRSDRPLDAAL